ncbi:hypothetical protein M8C21_009631 [Ambrosia artemisiifolia]|uniref:Uncharacterized protein n=1 Tax=Ambrosia artemisiifolia TaxID=4212 RepID=A0AAD5BMQ2_AMBAR|nr:hypothetical protein M8C21_009631 [Ambrosia artemisiifolia]
MKLSQKDSEKIIWDQMRSHSPPILSNRVGSGFPKLLFYLILFVSATYLIYTLKLLNTHNNIPPCSDQQQQHLIFSSHLQNVTVPLPNYNNNKLAKTELKHIVFGIAASAKLWDKRKNYIKLWWKKEDNMRGIVWLDNRVKTRPGEDDGLPEVRISGNTSHFSYKNKQGHRSAIRISRIVSETLRLGNMDNVRWFVMGDDDTVFVTENLVRVLNKYDHREYYYIGSLSESHLQNIYFSYGMAYGGGGFAISFPLAKALAKMQDRCIQRYPGLYGSDDRMQACMAELGVPLTKEAGFHQYDVYGNLFGLLAAHPVTPLVSLHHLDVVEPIFPDVTRVEALQRLMQPMKIDSAGLIQQSICYDQSKGWTVSVSWGADYTAYAFNTRPVARNPCQKPFVFYMTKVRLNSTTNVTVSEYARHRVPHPLCKWKMLDPSNLDKVVVLKKPDPHLWDRSPRRNCCRVLKSKRKGLVVDVGLCREDEVTEV